MNRIIYITILPLLVRIRLTCRVVVFRLSLGASPDNMFPTFVIRWRQLTHDDERCIVLPSLVNN